MNEKEVSMKKDFKFYAILGIIASILLIFLYSQLGAFQESFFISDSYSQYVALFSHFKEILLGHHSLFYSFQGGLGNGFLGTFFYYLCSPFNLLLFFFQDIEKFFLVTTLLKLVVACFTAFYCFRYFFQKTPVLYSATFALLYSWIDFTAHYFIQLMWLDALIALPLLLVGIDKFLRKKKFGLYLFALVYAIVTNYYFGYMIVLFTGIYFFYRLAIDYSWKKEKKEIFRTFLQFLLISFLGVLLTSPVLLIAMKEIPTYARSTSGLFDGESFAWNGNLFTFFSTFLLGNNLEIDFLNADAFYVYFGLGPLLLLFFFFFNPKFSKKKKIFTLLFIGIFYLSISGNYFSYLWSGLSKPQFFNGRFTFLFSFFFLFLALDSLVHLADLRKQDYLGAILLFLIFLGGYYFQSKNAILMEINLGLMLLYFFLLQKRESEKVYVPLIFVTLLIVEGVANSALATSEYGFTSKAEYQKQNKIYRYVTNFLESQDIVGRVENNVTVPYNGPLYYGYRGIDVFLSTITDEEADFFYRIGYGSGSTKKNTISYYSGNEVMDSLLGIRYHIFINEEEIPSKYHLLNYQEIDGDTIRIVENPLSLSIGYMVNEEILNVKENLNALAYQSDILEAMTKERYRIYTPISLEEEEGEYSFESSKIARLCFYTAIDSSRGYSNPSLYLNNFRLPKKYDFEIVCTEDTFDYEKRLSYVNLNSEEHLGTYAAYYSANQFEKAISSLAKNNLEIITWRDTYLKGTVEATKEKDILFTTIPYDSNWEIRVDGKKQKGIKVLNHLLGVKLENGKHEIELFYRPKTFYLGILLSFLSACFLFFLYKKRVFH